MEPEEVEFDITGLTLRGLSWGEEGAPTILASHGWLDNAASFSGVGPLFARRGYRVLAYDAAGHGRSDHRSPDAHYHYINYAIDLIDLVERLDLQEVVLMGHSMGAGVSLLAAGHLGERVSRLDLVEGLGPYTTAAEDAAETFSVAAAARRRVRNRERGVYASVADAVERKRAALGGLAESAARLLVERSLREVDGGWRFGDDPRLSGRSFLRLTEEQLYGFLDAVTQPVRLVLAEDGLHYAESVAEGRMARLARFEVERLPGGHHLHMERPESIVGVFDD